MLNYIKSDLYRIGMQVSFYVWCAALTVVPAAYAFTQMYDQLAATAMTRIILDIMGAAFFVFAIYITECTLREDGQYGLFKNDTTSGVSRSGIYLSKLLCGLVLMVLMWVPCSAACATVMAVCYTAGDGVAFLQGIFGLQGLVLLVRSAFYLALFQALSVVIKKTSMLILACIAASMVLSGAIGLIGVAIPQLPELQDRFGFGAVMANATGIDCIPVLFLMLLGGVAVTAFGNALFARKEL